MSDNLKVRSSWSCSINSNKRIPLIEPCFYIFIMSTECMNEWLYANKLFGQIMLTNYEYMLGSFYWRCKEVKTLLAYNNLCISLIIVGQFKSFVKLPTPQAWTKLCCCFGSNNISSSNCHCRDNISCYFSSSGCWWWCAFPKTVVSILFFAKTLISIVCDFFLSLYG